MVVSEDCGDQSQGRSQLDFGQSHCAWSCPSEACRMGRFGRRRRSQIDLVAVDSARHSGADWQQRVQLLPLSEARSGAADGLGGGVSKIEPVVRPGVVQQRPRCARGQHERETARCTGCEAVGGAPSGPKIGVVSKDEEERKLTSRGVLGKAIGPQVESG